jgi:medium-chain acyl-[acyl-carrier-protein] hydrolase
MVHVKSASNTTWLEHLSPAATPSLRLFCIPYAGGSANIYRAWQKWFPGQIDLCLVHLPGRGRRINEPPLNRLTPLATAIADCISERSSVPYALYGHSMGAAISFEVCRKLFRRKGPSPRHLLVSGRRAPQCPRDEPVTFNLPHDEFIEQLRNLNGTPREILDHPELMEIFINVLRADFEALETHEYQDGEPLPCPITVYGGLQDQDVPAEDCHAWKQQTSAECKVRLFQGDHFFIRDPEPEFIYAFKNDVLNIPLALSS